MKVTYVFCEELPTYVHWEMDVARSATEARCKISIFAGTDPVKAMKHADGKTLIFNDIH